MQNFYKRCQKLRNFYLTMEADNTKVIILSKIVAISFYNDKHLDDLPKGEILDIYCYGLSCNIITIQNCLASVLSDLQFNKFDIWHHDNYALFPTVHFIIND